MSDGPRLSGSASTTRDNEVQADPFSVVVHTPPKWDPSAEALTVTYDVHDPNSRIRGGRLYYCSVVLRPGAQWREIVCLHHQDLPLSALRHACHELPLADRWDGTISEGLNDRIGEKVTAELSNITVQLVVWNPGASPEDMSFTPLTEISTRSGDHFRTSGRSPVAVDAIVEARWNRNFCIPYDDPDEPQHGYRDMQITVKNVRQGTPVHLSVRRIADISSPSSDTPYADDEDETQTGLRGATVQGNRVLNASGAAPRVNFQNYRLHWPVDSTNNFYCFYVAFDFSRDFQVASERDYVNNERECLHMRFTVFIQMPAGDLPEYTGNGARLHRFFRSDTKYYRSYTLRAAGGAEAWHKYFRNRYIALVLGHAAQGCDHADHPTYTSGRRRGQKVDTYHAGFPPDNYVCPTELSEDRELRALYRSDPRGSAGCGHAEKVFHQNKLGRDTWMHNSWFPEGGAAYHSVWDKARHFILPAESLPKIYFWNGGCRTMVSVNLGAHFNRGGTKYYHGWVYSPACDYGRMAYDFFRRWIKGTGDDPAAVEYDNSRIETSYRAVTRARTRAKYQPRMMTGGAALPANPPPARVEDATR